MRILEIIENKRDGKPLTREEINFFVEGYTRGLIPDYQAAALLMAIYFQGMDEGEMAYLTEAMMGSGHTLDLSSISGIKVDKHSTGGVGDKVTLVLAPLVASTGIPIPMVSGRALGHTGGTLDKLESIPGFRTSLDNSAFLEQVKKINLAIVGQSPTLSPADGKLYSLRDVTGTVPSIPLIVGSILSKKFAAGIDALVLDVKTGNGAFMRTMEESKALAKALGKTCEKMGKRAIALITDMDQPLGYAVGNSLEVKEAISCLKGKGPRDLLGVSLALGAWMTFLGKRASNLEEGRLFLEENLKAGGGLKKLQELIEAQGGDPRVIDKPDLLPSASHIYEGKSPRDGYVQRIDARAIGELVRGLGAGREHLGQAIDHRVGLVLKKKVGDKVEKDEPLAELHLKDRSQLSEAHERLLSAFVIGNKAPEPRPLIHKTIPDAVNSEL